MINFNENNTVVFFGDGDIAQAIITAKELGNKAVGSRLSRISEPLRVGEHIKQDTKFTGEHVDIIFKCGESFDIFVKAVKKLNKRMAEDWMPSAGGIRDDGEGKAD